MNRISFYSGKGGVGKTSLAFSVAKDRQMFYITNDDSTVESIYTNMAKAMDVPALIDNCVYDFGGFANADIVEILKNSDVVVIPFTADLNALKKTILTIEEVENDNIVLVANMAEKDDFVEIIEALKARYKYPIFEIRKSRIWAKTFKEEKSILDIAIDSALNKYVYAKSVVQYKKLLDYLGGVK